jgi:hypothetical protein
MNIVEEDIIMAKVELTSEQLVESHKPKNFKFKYLFKENELIDELMNSDYDITTLDTICNDDLVNAALSVDYVKYERTIIGKAKEPTILDNGVIVSKKMATKADKKLLGVYIGFFNYNNARYVGVKLEYEKFEILEIFGLV